MRHSYKIICYFGFLSIIILFSCGKQHDPEDEIREYLAAIEESAMNKNIADMKKGIADNYTDKSNHNKKEIIRIIAAYFLRTPNIYIQSKIESLQINATGSDATVTVYAAISQTPISDDDVQILQADIHKFDFELHKQKSWLLISSDWQRVPVDAFIRN